MVLSLIIVDRAADQVIFPDRAQEHPGQRPEGDHALPRQLCQGQLAERASEPLVQARRD